MSPWAKAALTEKEKKRKEEEEEEEEKEEEKKEEGGVEGRGRGGAAVVVAVPQVLVRQDTSTNTDLSVFLSLPFLSRFLDPVAFPLPLGVSSSSLSDGGGSSKVFAASHRPVPRTSLCFWDAQGLRMSA